MPGAGDDEESWARGLTPQMMWANREAVVQAGPAGIHALLAALLCEQQPQFEPAAPRHHAQRQHLPGEETQGCHAVMMGW